MTLLMVLGALATGFLLVALVVQEWEMREAARRDAARRGVRRPRGRVW